MISRGIQHQAGPDNVSVEPALSDQHVPALCFFKHTKHSIGRWFLCYSVPYKFETLHQSESADVANDRVPLLEFFQSQSQVAADFSCIFLEIVVFDLLYD